MHRRQFVTGHVRTSAAITGVATLAATALIGGSAMAATGASPTAPTGAAGAISVVSASAKGRPANVDGVDLSVGSGLVTSADHRKVAFFSVATNLVPGVTPTPGLGHLYVKDLRTGAITVADASASGTPGTTSAVYYSAFSPDGTQIAFDSTATNLVPSVTTSRPWGEVYVKNLLTGSIRLVSSLDDGTPMNLSYLPVAAAAIWPVDNDHVIFQAAVAPNRDTTAFGIPARTPEIFEKDLTTGAINVVSSSTAGSPADAGVGFRDRSPVFVPAPDEIVFESHSDNLLPGVSGYQVYAKNLTTGAVTLASATSAGVPATGMTTLTDLTFTATADPSRVLIQTAAANFPGALRRRQQIYVKDLSTGSLTLVSANVRGVAGNGSSTDAVASPDGTMVAFTSAADNLLPGAAATTSRIYVKHLATGRVTAITAGDSSVHVSLMGFSPNGRHLLFGTDQGGPTTNAVDEADLANGTVRTVSASAAGVPAAYADVDAAYVDANDVVFASTQDLGITVPRTAEEIYLKHIDR